MSAADLLTAVLSVLLVLCALTAVLWVLLGLCAAAATALDLVRRRAHRPPPTPTDETLHRSSAGEQGRRMLTPPDLRCPHCGHRYNTHTCLSTPEATPSPGDVSLCWRCMAPATYEVSPLGVLQLRALTPDEERHVMVAPAVTAAIDARATSTTPSQAVRQTRDRLKGSR